MADYLKRVHRRWPAEDLPQRAVTGGRDQDPSRALQREADAVRRSVPDGWSMVVLHEGGQALGSTALAHALRKAEDGGSAGLVFVIGSDLGLDPGLRRDAAWSLSLGLMTLPHLLARLVLWEQLFRATDILGGGGYHRPGVQ